METLTGLYYFEKRFFGGFNVMVQVMVTSYNTFAIDIYNEPKQGTYFRKAKMEDLVLLGLNMSNEIKLKSE